MPDYSKSVIYTIRSKDNIYVGSTVNFRSRKKQHKNCITNENLKTYNIKLYKTIRDNDGEWDMQPHSIFPCGSKMELKIEEERVRQLLTADLNSQSCGTGLDRPDYKKQHNKQYYETHYEKYRDEFNKKRRQKFTCECGGVTTKGGLSIHRKSKKHILGMEKLNQ
jgi:hypothetical protein